MRRGIPDAQGLTLPASMSDYLLDCQTHGTEDQIEYPPASLLQDPLAVAASYPWLLCRLPVSSATSKLAKVY